MKEERGRAINQSEMNRVRRQHKYEFNELFMRKHKIDQKTEDTKEVYENEKLLFHSLIVLKTCS